MHCASLLLRSRPPARVKALEARGEFLYCRGGGGGVRAGVRGEQALSPRPARDRRSLLNLNLGPANATASKRINYLVLLKQHRTYLCVCVCVCVFNDK